MQAGLDFMLGASPQCVEKGSDNFTLKFRLDANIRPEDATAGFEQSVEKSQRV